MFREPPNGRFGCDCLLRLARLGIFARFFDAPLLVSVREVLLGSLGPDSLQSLGLVRGPVAVRRSGMRSALGAHNNLRCALLADFYKRFYSDSSQSLFDSAKRGNFEEKV